MEGERGRIKGKERWELREERKERRGHRRRRVREEGKGKGKKWVTLKRKEKGRDRKD